LDVAGLDADGEVVVPLEAEQSNHDTLRAVPDDYDKMAGVDSEAANLDRREPRRQPRRPRGVE